MPTARMSENIKRKIDAVLQKTGWTQEQFFEWFFKDLDPSKTDFFMEGPTIVISRVPVRKAR